MKSLVENLLLGENGWTRPQYALFRVVLGLHLLVTSILLILSLTQSLMVAFAIAAALASVFFIFGAFESISAYVLAALWALVFGVLPSAPHHSEPLMVYLLLAHTEVTPTTRKDLEQAMKWRMPQPVYSLIWLIGIVFFTWVGASIVLGLDYPILAVLYLVAPLAIFPRFRFLVWCVTLFVALYLVAALGDIVLSLLLFQFFTFDPKWVPRKGSAVPDTIFYDGGCGLCHRAVLFALEQDRTGELFRFSPLGSEAFVKAIPEEKRAALPDSIVIVTSTGDVMTKSLAAARIGKRLGGVWRILATVLVAIPRPIGDFGYDVVARLRKKIFRAPVQACPIVPEALQARFT